MRKIVRHLLNPISRPALIMLVWTKRHTVRQWLRSIQFELQRGPFEWPRFKTLVRALFRISTDPEHGNSPQVRSLRVVGDTIEVEADPRFPTDRVRELLMTGTASGV